MVLSVFLTIDAQYLNVVNLVMERIYAECTMHHIMILEILGVRYINQLAIPSNQLFESFVGNDQKTSEVEIDMFQNLDLENIVTPVDPKVLQKYLVESNYDPDETQFLVQGFEKGFDIQYNGPANRTSNAQNLPFTVGSPIELWNKLMKEVKLKRVAGPFDEVPFTNYIQSPIGLVPKAGGNGNQTRLIFHLSYEFKQSGEPAGSVNSHTPCKLCSVQYNDLDHAVKNILIVRQQSEAETENGSESTHIQVVYMGKSDIRSAFRVLPLNPESWKWLIMKARNPVSGEWQYFVDKCLPFGSSISCALFQKVSNALRHIVEFRTGSPLTNYLDDFLFYALTVLRCNYLLRSFIDICTDIGVPIAHDKTEWAETCTVFLGILLDGRNFLLCLPIEKRDRPIHLLKTFIDKKKATIHQLQVLCGYLNFLGKAIYPGRVFTRRMYAKYGKLVNINQSVKDKRWEKHFNFRKHHHVKLDAEFKLDCQVWLTFLMDSKIEKLCCRPMLDLSESVIAKDIGFASDASAAVKLGFGAVLGNCWIFGAWGPDFIKTYKPSIEYLELFALCAGIFTWQEELSNCRIIVHCDNQAVVSMVNSISSTCPNCMYLLRMLVLNGLKFNRRIFARYISTKANFLPDALSRLDFARFRRLGPNMNEFADQVCSDIWPIQKVWRNIKR